MKQPKNSNSRRKAAASKAARRKRTTLIKDRPIKDKPIKETQIKEKPIRKEYQAKLSVANEGEQALNEALTILAALFSAVCLISLITKKMGFMGTIINNILTGLFGFGAVIISIAVAVFCVWLLTSPVKTYKYIRLGCIFGIAALTGAIMDTFNAVYLPKGVTVSDALALFYQNGSLLNGGLIGGAISYILKMAFNGVVSIIIISALILACIIGATGKSFFRFVADLRSADLEPDDEELDYAESEEKEFIEKERHKASKPIAEAKKKPIKRRTESEAKFYTIPPKPVKKAVVNKKKYNYNFEIEATENKPNAPEVKIPDFGAEKSARKAAENEGIVYTIRPDDEKKVSLGEDEEGQKILREIEKIDGDLKASESKAKTENEPLDDYDEGDERELSAQDAPLEPVITGVFDDEPLDEEFNIETVGEKNFAEENINDVNFTDENASVAEIYEINAGAYADFEESEGQKTEYEDFSAEPEIQAPTFEQNESRREEIAQKLLSRMSSPILNEMPSEKRKQSESGEKIYTSEKEQGEAAQNKVVRENENASKKRNLYDIRIENAPKKEENEPVIQYFERKKPTQSEILKPMSDLAKNIQKAKSEYVFPPFELLTKDENGQRGMTKTEMITTAQKLEETLQSFGVNAKVIQVNHGPTVTRYELSPSQGVKVSKIVNLADDIALNLAASGIRIEAPIPGKAAVGIEVPNKTPRSVYLRSVIDTKEFREFPSKLAFAVGQDITGKTIVSDIAKMPHLLIAGATGSGKSVCINTLIASILYKASPDEVRLIMIDPKVVELSVYNGIPHLLIPVVTDPKKAAGALNWAVKEMLKRYNDFAENSVRDITGFNAKKRRAGELEKIMPHMVIIIDELADLMLASPGEVEDAICRLAQMARAAGMHLIIATQRPSVDVITGVIKANIPSRLAFAVSSGTDSRTILDSVGAEKLLGKGDMLFCPIGQNKPTRIQGAFITDNEVEMIVDFLKSNNSEVEYDEKTMEVIASSAKSGEFDDVDELFSEAVEFVIKKDKASTSMIQRQFRIGYNRAARIIEDMEDRGMISEEDGSKPRRVLITYEELDNMREEGII